MSVAILTLPRLLHDAYPLVAGERETKGVAIPQTLCHQNNKAKTQQLHIASF